MTNRTHRLSTALLAGFASIMAPVALAHTGVSDTSGLMAGLMHPMGGWDHLLAMVAVGLFAAQLGGRALWAVPAAFVGLMIAGGAFGVTGLGLPFAEAGVLMSVVVLGGLIAVALRIQLAAAMAIVGLFAIFHGFAHGAEMPLGMGGFAYSAGFALTTALLHGLGIGAGLLCKRLSADTLTRWVGGAIALSGLVLAVA